MIARRVALMAAVVLLCLLAFSVVRPAKSQAGSAPAAFSGSITVEAPTRIVAGATPEIEISATAPDGAVVELYVVGAVDTQRFVSRLRDGATSLRLPASSTEHAGQILLVVTVGDARASTQMTSVARGAVDPVVPLVGPRTIIADDQDMTMVVIVAADEFGNPVADGTEASVSLARPGGQRQIITTPADGGVASSLIRSDTVAGRVVVTSEVDGADGPAHSFDQVAGQPADFTLLAPSTATPVADGFSLHPIETSVLRDVFGNLLPDGVVVEFVIDGPQGRSLAAATVQAGRSRTVIEAPGLPGDIIVTARVSGRASRPLGLTFASAVTSFDAELVDGSVVVGPVLAIRGGYVADGTTATVIEVDTGDTVTTGSLLAGKVTIPLALGTPTDSLAVSVLGAERVVDNS